MHCCLVEVFQLDPDYALSDDMGPSDVTGWDSLGWLTLLNAVESRYGIVLSLDEAAEIRTIGDLRRAIEAKTLRRDASTGRGIRPS